MKWRGEPVKKIRKICFEIWIFNFSFFFFFFEDSPLRTGGIPFQQKPKGKWKRNPFFARHSSRVRLASPPSKIKYAKTSVKPPFISRGCQMHGVITSITRVEVSVRSAAIITYMEWPDRRRERLRADLWNAVGVDIERRWKPFKPGLCLARCWSSLTTRFWSK